MKSFEEIREVVRDVIESKKQVWLSDKRGPEDYWVKHYVSQCDYALANLDEVTRIYIVKAVNGLANVVASEYGISDSYHIGITKEDAYELFGNDTMYADRSFGKDRALKKVSDMFGFEIPSAQKTEEKEVYLDRKEDLLRKKYNGRKLTEEEELEKEREQLEVEEQRKSLNLDKVALGQMSLGNENGAYVLSADESKKADWSISVCQKRIAELEEKLSQSGPKM